jgi:hypothetical protein
MRGLCLQVLWCRNVKIVKKNYIFSTLSPPKIIMTSLPHKLQNSYGPCLKVTEILLSQICNSHTDRVILISVSYQVPFDLHFPTNVFFFCRRDICLVHSFVVWHVAVSSWVSHGLLLWSNDMADTQDFFIVAEYVICFHAVIHHCSH